MIGRVIGLVFACGNAVAGSFALDLEHDLRARRSAVPLRE